jgi:hypothetical protein
VGVIKTQPLFFDAEPWQFIAVGLLLPADVSQDLPTRTLSPLSKLVIDLKAQSFVL